MVDGFCKALKCKRLNLQSRSFLSTWHFYLALKLVTTPLEPLVNLNLISHILIEIGMYILSNKVQGPWNWRNQGGHWPPKCLEINTKEGTAPHVLNVLIAVPPQRFLASVVPEVSNFYGPKKSGEPLILWLFKRKVWHYQFFCQCLELLWFSGN